MTIFLSASVPDPKRDEVYHATADVIAIRDAVRALVTVVLPRARLVWGGHPAITPLVRIIAQDLGITSADRVRLFQSSIYRGMMPKDNAVFESVTIVPGIKGDKETSLLRMRQKMIGSEKFSAGVFIGGMDGVEEEYRMFCAAHPNATVLPVASTGAAALRIFNEQPAAYPRELKDDYAYPTLFRRLLGLQSSPPR